MHQEQSSHVNGGGQLVSNGNGLHLEEQYKQIAHIEDENTSSGDDSAKPPITNNDHSHNGHHINDRDEIKHEKVNSGVNNCQIENDHNGQINHENVENDEEYDDEKVITEEFIQEHTVESFYKDLKETSIEIGDDIEPQQNQNRLEMRPSTSVCSGVEASVLSKPSLNGNVNNDAEVVCNKPDMSNRFLFKVRATYAYEAKELDELHFAKDDLIVVVEGSESEKEDLDEGWLIGIHENTRRRGLFPENFTKRVV